MGKKIIGIIGAGAMGSGIAQVAATAGHTTILYDAQPAMLDKAKAQLQSTLDKLEQKGKIPSANALMQNLQWAQSINDLKDCDVIIEAIVENLDIKKAVFKELESLVSDACILASNTSSLPISAIGAVLQKPERIIGLHFFNPPPLMALVEVIPAVQTADTLVEDCMQLMSDWGKIPVRTKDTPGFIVNKVARPYYGEALRIYEEGIADIKTIDWALTHLAGFRMGPFTLMDYIGHDVNYVVTATVFEAFYYDPRYKPSISQKRLLEAQWLGRKSGKGFYNYQAEPQPLEGFEGDPVLGQQIVDRVLAMLVNEAYDTVHMGIASAADVDLAMTKGVNYPKGLISWGKEIGLANIVATLDQLYNHYQEDRYRTCPGLRKAVLL